MFTFALLAGIYSYLIFILGMFDVLTKINIFFVTAVVVVIGALFFEKNKSNVLSISNTQKNKLSVFFLSLFVLQAIVNLIGALGPEIAFDALWYHLTLPKLYLLNHSIYHIPGGLLYYSTMPKLAEMLYVGGLAFGNEIVVKLIHYSFGILVAVATYKLSRTFFSPRIALIAMVTFYANLVVAWESITAYIDLIRTFFEIMTLWGFLQWVKTAKKQWIIMSASMMGLAITTKLLAVGSLIIFLILIIYNSFRNKMKILDLLKNVSLFLFVAFLIPLPWFIFSALHTGNPVYPFFTTTYKVSPAYPNPFQIIFDLWNLLLYSPDPISPIYLICLPLIFIFYNKLRIEVKLIVIYAILGIFMWYFTPRTGGGRFILPYLPAFSIIVASIVDVLLKNKERSKKYLVTLILVIITVVSLISIGYRFMANSNYLSVIFGQETKQTFLSDNLNYAFGDFYDTDRYFETHIKEGDKVLLFGFHNLYYVDFPYIHSSWIKKGDTFNYIATQNDKLPKRFKDWNLVYENKQTHVKLYSAERKQWKY